MFEEFVINRFLFVKNLSVSFLCKYRFFLENVILYFHFFLSFFNTQPFMSKDKHVMSHKTFRSDVFFFIEKKLAYNKRSRNLVKHPFLPELL